jgi:hypothetical protein
MNHFCRLLIAGTAGAAFILKALAIASRSRGALDLIVQILNCLHELHRVLQYGFPQQQQQQILFLVPQGDRLPNRPNLVYPTPIPKTLYIMYHGPNWQSNGRMVLTTGRLYNTKAWAPLSPVKVQPQHSGTVL